MSRLMIQLESVTSLLAANVCGRRRLFKTVVALVVMVISGTLWYARDLQPYSIVSQFLNTQFQIYFIPLNRPEVIGWLVNSSSCQMPDYDPWDESILDVVNNEIPFRGCPQDYSVQIQQQGNLLFMSTNSATENSQCHIECCYRSVARANEGQSDNDFKFGSTTICFMGQPSLKVNDEFIHIRCFCSHSNATIYEDFRAFIIPKPRKALLADTTNTRDDKLNVYLIGIDSVSRLNFKRFLPDIENVLGSQFDAIPMTGFTKVGVNTYPNMLACLTGASADQLSLSPREEPIDSIPFVWKQFSKLGYVTMFNEDVPFASMFNFAKKGFYTTPTDYYMRPVQRAIDESQFVRNQETLCFNQREQIDFQLQWLQDLMSQADASPQFSLLFNSAMSHEGPLTYVKALQPRLHQFLKWYRSSARYNSSILFFFSDHGARYGPIMRHEQGGYEARLPFFYVILPPWYSSRYPERVANLRTNSARLTTFFDVHATLRDLLRDAGAAGADLPALATPGVSLFSAVPRERSCDAAGIAAQWCVCRERRPVPTGSEVAQRAATAAVRHINTQELREVRAQCAELRLLRVTGAAVVRTERGATAREVGYSREGFDELVVQLVTAPGEAEFEATVRSGAGRRVTVVGVTRLNRYRGQSDCLTQRYDEKRFCFCKDLL